MIFSDSGLSDKKWQGYDKSFDIISERVRYKKYKILLILNIVGKKGA